MKAYIVEQSILAENTRILVEKAGAAAVYGVIKGNGYGLGLIPMARILWENGITRFAVTEPSEVKALREAGFQLAEILMMRETGLEQELRELMEQGAVITVGCPETAARAAQVAAALGITCPCHVKIDTGMGRYGFLPEELDAIAAVYQTEHLTVQGIYTHFYSAYDNEKVTRAQFAAFQQVLSGLEAQGITPGLRHCCNSSAFLKYPEMHLDGVRLGSAILGRLAFSGVSELRPVGWCEAQVEVIRTLPKGHTVGYGGGWKAKRPTKIAVFSVGYYHGFGAPARNDLSRFRDCLVGVLSNVKAFLTHRAIYVSINGQRARVLGHVGMVQTICDVTDIPCQVGDTIRIDINPLKFQALDILYRN